MLDERTERLITKRLDGRLSDDESLELDKLLIRSPEARQALDDSEAIDRRTAQSLRGLFDDSVAVWGRATGHLEANRHRTWPFGLGVAAAFVLLIAGLPMLDRSRPVIDPPVAAFDEPMVDRDAMGAILPVNYTNAEPGEIAGTIVGPRQYRRQIHQNVIGVLDPETQNVYLLELRTARDMVHGVRANY